MIPKIIHYCWFGSGPKSELIEKCISSWNKYLPDYEIIEWNEDNFDISSNLYVKQAYEAKKWAFVSDYVRLFALYTCGGVYLDTDVEILKPFDSAFLQNRAFTGFEAKDSPVTAVLGAEKGNPIIDALLSYYLDHVFINADGSYNLKTNTNTISEFLIQNGILPNGKLQDVSGFRVYPQIYFVPIIYLVYGMFPQKRHTQFITLMKAGKTSGENQQTCRKSARDT